MLIERGFRRMKAGVVFLALSQTPLWGQATSKMEILPILPARTSLHSNATGSFRFWVSNSGRCEDRNTPGLGPNQVDITAQVNGLRTQVTGLDKWFDQSLFRVGTHGLFGAERGRNRAGLPAFHGGVDLPAPAGTAIFAPTAGRYQFLIQDQTMDRPPGLLECSANLLQTTPGIRPATCPDLRGAINSGAGWLLLFDPTAGGSTYSRRTSFQHIEQWSQPHLESAFREYRLPFSARLGDVIGQVSMTGNAGAECVSDAPLPLDYTHLAGAFHAKPGAFDRGGPHLHLQVGPAGSAVEPYSAFPELTFLTPLPPIRPLAGVIQKEPGAAPLVYNDHSYFNTENTHISFPLPAERFKAGGTVRVYFELFDEMFMVKKATFRVERRVFRVSDPFFQHLQLDKGPEIILKDKIFALNPHYKEGPVGRDELRFFPEWELPYLTSRWMNDAGLGDLAIRPSLNDLSDVESRDLGFNMNAVPKVEFDTEDEPRCGRWVVSYWVIATVENLTGRKLERKIAAAVFRQTNLKCPTDPNDRADDTRDLSAGSPSLLASSPSREGRVEREMVGAAPALWVNGYSAKERGNRIDTDYLAWLASLPPATEDGANEVELTQENDPEQWAFVGPNQESHLAWNAGRSERDQGSQLIVPLKVLDGNGAPAFSELLDSIQLASSKVHLAESLAPEKDVLLIPTGGLIGLWQSPSVRSWLEEFVGGGGTMLVLDQQHGEHFSVLPRGDEIEAVGWDEAQTCFANAARIEQEHPGLAGVPGPIGSTVNVGVDGHFRRLPADADVLLRATGSDYPVLATYPYGAGRVVVTSLFEDDAKRRGMSSQAGVSIVHNLVEWLRKPVALPTLLSAPSGVVDVSRPVKVRNLTQWPATRVTFHWVAPNGAIAHEEQHSLALLPGEESIETASWSIPQPAKPGVWFVDYSLQDDQWPVQIRGLDVDSRFVIGAVRVGSAPASAKVLAWVTVPTESANPIEPLPVTLHVRNLTNHDFTTTSVEWKWWRDEHANPWFKDSGSLENFTVPSGSEITRTIAPQFRCPAVVRFDIAGNDPGHLEARKVLEWRAPEVDLQIVWPATHVSGTPLVLPYTLSNPNGYPYSGEIELYYQVIGGDPAVVVPVNVPSTGSVGGDLVLNVPPTSRSWTIFAQVKTTSSRGDLIAARSRGAVQFLRSSLLAERLPATLSENGLPRIGIRLAVPVGAVGPGSGTVTLTAEEGSRTFSQVFALSLAEGEAEDLTLEVPFPIPAYRLLRLHWSETDETRPALPLTGQFSYSSRLHFAAVADEGVHPIGANVTLHAIVGATDLPFAGILTLAGPTGEEDSLSVALAPGETTDLSATVAIPPSAISSHDNQVIYSWELLGSSGGSVRGSQAIRVSPWNVTLALHAPPNGWLAGEPSSATIELINNQTHFAAVPVEIELFVPGLGVLATVPTVLPPTGAVNVPVVVQFPISPVDELYPITARLRAADSGRYLSFAYSTASTRAPRCEVVLAAVPGPIAPGDELDVQLLNVGSSALNLQTTWTLESANGATILNGDRAELLPSGGSAQLPVIVPSPLPTGTYFLRISSIDTATSLPVGALSEGLQVSGDEATMAVSTDRPSYLTGESIPVAVNVTAGGQGLAGGAGLALEVLRLAPGEGEPSWPTCFSGPVRDAEATDSGETWIVWGNSLGRMGSDPCELASAFSAGVALDALAVASSTDIWVASASAALHFDGVSFAAPVTLPSSAAHVTDARLDSSGHLWLLREGASSLIEVANQVATAVPGPGASPIESIFINSGDTVWLISGGSLWERSGTTWLEHAPPVPFDFGPAPGPSLLAFGPSGNAWISGRTATSEATPVVYRFEPLLDGWSEVAIPFQFPSNCLDDSHAGVGLSADGKLLVGISYGCEGPGAFAEGVIVSGGVEIFIEDGIAFRSLGSISYSTVGDVPWRLFGTAPVFNWLSDGEAISRQQSGRNTIAWGRHDELSQMAPGAAYTLDDLVLDTLEPGEYLLRGELAFGPSLPVASHEQPFAIQAAEVELHLATARPGLAAALPSGLGISAELRNRTSSPLTNVELRIRASSPTGIESLLATLAIAALAPEATISLPATLAVAEEGRYTLTADLLGEAGTLTLAEQTIFQEGVAASVGVTVAPPSEVVEGETSALAVEVVNESPAPLSVVLALEPPDPSRAPHALILDPNETALVSLPVGDLPVSGDFIAAVSGQATAQAPVAIVRSGLTHLTTEAPAQVQEGRVEVPMHLVNTGAPTAYSVIWSLDGVPAGAASGLLQRGASWSGLADLNLTPGPHVLAISATGTGTQEIPMTAVARDLAEILDPAVSGTAEGVVPVRFTIRNPSSFVEQLPVAVRALGSGNTVAELRETVELGPGEALSLGFPLLLPAGEFSISILAGQASYSVPVQLIPRTAGRIELSVVERSPGRARVRAVVENIGVDVWSGEIVAGGLLDGSSYPFAELGPSESATTEWNFEFAELSVGDHEVSGTVVVNGADLDTTTVQLEVAPPSVSLLGTTVPEQFNAGDVARFEAELANTGDLPETVTFRVDGGGLGQSSTSFNVPPSMSFKVAQTLEIPHGLESGVYSLGYLLTRSDNSVVGSGGTSFAVQGLTATVEASLDSPWYAPGAQVMATFDIAASGEGLGPGFELRVAYGDESSIFPVDLTSGAASVNAELIASAQAAKLAFGLYDPNGRGVFLDASYLRVSSALVRFHTNSDRYLPGETVLLTVEPAEPGTLQASFFEEEVTREATGPETISFTVPGDTPAGTSIISLQFTSASGMRDALSVPVDVSGVRIRVFDQHFDRSAFDSGDSVAAQLTLLSSHATNATIEATLVDPLGEEVALPDRAVDLEADQRTIVPLSYSLEGTVPGFYLLQLAVSDGNEIAQAGAGTLLAFHTPFLTHAELDPATSPESGEPARLLFSAAGEGPAMLRVELDGVQVYSAPIALAGYFSGAVPLDSVALGYHEGSITLQSSYVSTLPLKLQIGSAPMALPPTPDLVVTNSTVEVTSLVNGNLGIQAEVRNTGELPTGPFVVRISAGGTEEAPLEIGRVSVSSLDSNQAAPFALEWNPIGYNATTRITATADIDDEVQERHEWNNEGSGFALLSALGSAVEVSPSILGTNETATVSVWVKNRSADAMQNVTVDLQIMGGGGTMPGSSSWLLPVLESGQSYSTTVPFDSMLKPAGDYLCHLTVRNEAGDLQIAETSFRIQETEEFTGFVAVAWSEVAGLGVDYTVHSNCNVFVNIGEIVLEVYEQGSGLLVDTIPLAGWLSAGQEISLEENYPLPLPNGTYVAQLVVRGNLVAEATFNAVNSGLIFADGFESATPGEWSAVVTPP